MAKKKVTGAKHVRTKKRTKRKAPSRSSATAATSSTNLPARRWTEPLLKTGFVPVARIFLRNYSRLQPPITPQEALFIVHLIDFKRDENHPYPSYKRLAGFMGVSDKMVRLYAKSLEGKGYIRRIARVARPNFFDLTPLFETMERRFVDQAKPIQVTEEGS